MKVAVLLTAAVTFDGCVVIDGANVTVSVAAWVVAEPPEFVNMASYSLPFSLAEATNE